MTKFNYHAKLTCLIYNIYFTYSCIVTNKDKRNI